MLSLPMLWTYLFFSSQTTADRFGSQFVPLCFQCEFGDVWQETEKSKLVPQTFAAHLAPINLEQKLPSGFIPNQPRIIYEQQRKETVNNFGPWHWSQFKILTDHKHIKDLLSCFFLLLPPIIRHHVPL